MNRPHPLALAPLFKERVWGGRALERFFDNVTPPGRVGEAWVLGEHPNGTNLILNGDLAGGDLGVARREHGEALVGLRGTQVGAQRFPLLIKLLDAHDRLSVQVHPGDGNPLLPAGESGKTEMWYVLNADPGATITLGLRDGIGPREFSRAIETGGVADCLQEVPVQAGDACLIPAGTVHALGAGVLVAEIQQSSDTTYRVYDYDRVGLDGRRRELHIEQALAVVDYRRSKPVRRTSSRKSLSNQWTELARCRQFVVERGVCEGNWAEETTLATFQALLVCSGRGRLEWEGGEAVLEPGRATLLPAALGPYSLAGSMEVLRTWLPAVRSPSGGTDY